MPNCFFEQAYILNSSENTKMLKKTSEDSTPIVILIYFRYVHVYEARAMQSDN